MIMDFKNKVFARIRSGRLARKVLDLNNYLENVEVRIGIVELQGKRVLVVAPHPDDESIACGGTLQAIVERGGTVDVLFLTGGEKGFGPGKKGSKEEGERLRQTRRDEASAACRVLGLTGYETLAGCDGKLHLQGEMGDTLREWIGEKRYDAFFCPWPNDQHSDHIAAFRFFAQAMRTYPHAASIWLFEVWAPCLANRVVDIDKYIERKVEAIRCYQSQVTSGIDYAEKFRALSRYRSLLIPTASHAEAFLVGDKAFVLRLASQPARS